MCSLVETAEALCAPGKGLLASDESTGTIGKRFQKYGIENTEDNRRAYRELFYTADVGQYYSGAIMYKETLYQNASDGRPFKEILTSKGVQPGIKVDEGLSPIPGTAGETETKGMEVLAEACKEYVAAGAKFTKWRAALKVGGGCPSDKAIEVNARQLAQYAKICQEAGLVPVVEPEILIDGDHTQQQFGDVSEKVISACVVELWRQGVQLEACLLKPQMIIPGTECPSGKVGPEAVAEATLRVMRRVVPAAIPGIMFLSGGQTEEEATLNLDALNRLANSSGRVPWAMSFSFGRALQASVLQSWSASPSNTAEAKRLAAAVAAANSAAARGQYEGPHPSITSKASLHETFRGWSGQAAA